MSAPRRKTAEARADLILERSLLGAIAALVPLPFIDDALLRRSRTTLLHELATAAGLRLDAAALAALTEAPRRSMVQRAGLGVLQRALRGAATPLRVAGRARAALETFQLATLLDHYARRHHRGLDLDADRAKALRRSFDEVIGETRLRLGDLRRPTAHAEALRTGFDARWTREPT